MKIGTVVIYKGQQYELEGFKPHVCKDGRKTELALFRSHCKRCGEPFITMVPSHEGEPRLTVFSRRCSIHATRRLS